MALRGLPSRVRRRNANAGKTQIFERRRGRTETTYDRVRIAGHDAEVTGKFIAARYGFAGLRAAGEIFLAFVMALQNNDRGAAGRIARGLSVYEKKYGKLFLPYFYSILAGAHLELQNFTAAEQAAKIALDIVKRFGEYWYQSALLDLQARAASQGRLADPAEIARWRRHGLTIATAQQAELFAHRIRNGRDEPRG